MQRKLMLLLFCLITPTVSANYSCNIFNAQDAFSMCNERVEFSKKINLPTDSSEFGIFYDQSDKLKKLVKNSEYLHASKVFNDYKDEYFLKKSFFGGKVPFEQDYKLLSKVARNLNENYQTEADELENTLIHLNRKLNNSDITKSEGRDALQKVIEFKEQLIVDYRSHQILRFRKFKEPIFADIGHLIPQTSNALRNYSKRIKIPFINDSSNSDSSISSSTQLTWVKFFAYVFFGLVVLGMFMMPKSKDEPPPPPVDDSERRRLLALWKKRVTRIKRANSMLAKYLNNDTGYFSNYQENYWLSQHKKLLDEISGQSYGKVGLSDSDINTIKQFVSNYKNTANLRKKFNAAFISSELKKYNAFFDNIEGRKLDEQQRTAVVTDEDNNLIIAGAGSGKTTTIVGKVHYILDKYKVKPEEVLLISFTKASATDLKKRIDIDGVEVKTFHKFGLDVLSGAENKKPSIFESHKFTQLLTGIFKKLLKDQEYIKQVNTFASEYLQQPKSQFDFKTKGEYYQYLRDQNFKTFKVSETRNGNTGKVTLKREVVKSVEECKIANFLLFNGIKYKYEAPYEHDTASKSYMQYRPDFTIFQNGKKIYFEHFGVNKDGQVPPFFANDGETHQQATKRYTDGIRWKRELHKTHSTVLIETYSYEMWKQDDIFYDKLKQRLIDFGVELNPKTPEEIWEIINEFYRNEERELVKLFGTFITLMKSNQFSIKDVRSRADKIEKGFLKNRNHLFLDIIEPIYEEYEAHLIKKKQIDFSDMINKATNYIASRKYKRKISYVIIDEFQDISIGRYNLVREIKKSNPGCRLFCVGDDWQSIYRFAGSDIALFKDFTNYFGVTERLKIETTYRFHNPLIDLSSEFIQQNPNQAKKKLRSADADMRTNYQIRYSKFDDTSTLIDIFNELVDIYGDIEHKKITILARHNFDFEVRIKNEDKLLNVNDNNVSYLVQTEEKTVNIEANIQSIHSAKGLEADIVIIINCNSGKFGLPNQMADDPTLNLLLSEADQFENGEERRLFYVAMTRAKEMLYLVTDSYNKSKFITEIEVEEQVSNIKCSVCKAGEMLPKKSAVAKNGNRYIFYGCNNYEYGCANSYSVFENQEDWVEDDY